MKTPKINKAFKKLHTLGIVALKNFTCCQTCGHHEIDDFLDSKKQSYIFYHSQSNDDLKENGSCYVAHSIRKKDKQKVFNVLNEFNLKPKWDFANNQAILITEKEKNA